MYGRRLEGSNLSCICRELLRAKERNKHLLELPKVQGIGVSHQAHRISLYVEHSSAKVPSEIEGFKVKKMEVGVLRPYHGVSAGVSVGTYSEFLSDEIEGTLGMAFLDETGNPVLLSSNHVFCYHPDTEVLTSSGFKNISELNTGDRVLTRSPEGLIESKAIESTVTRDWDGSLLRFHGRFHDITVTPDHNMFVLGEMKGRDKARRWRPQLMQASDLVSHSAYHVGGRESRLGYAYHFSTMGSWEGKSEDFTMPRVEYIKGRDFNVEKPMRSDLFAYFLGWWLGDGSLATTSDPGYITTIRSTRRSELITAKTLLDKLGFHAQVGISDTRVYSKQLYNFLHPLKLNGKGNKEFPRWMLNYSRETLQSLILGYLRADGCFTDTGYVTATTVSQSLAYGFQEAAFKAGITTRMHLVKGSPFNPNGEYYALTFHKAPHERLRIWPPEKIEYRGKVHCITVPNHVVLVKGNIKSVPIWCGNCGIDTVQHPTAHMGQPIWEDTPYGKHNIATLEKWIPINEEGGNIAEPAIAKPLSTITINPEVLGLGIPEAIADPVPQLPVMKMGRGTILTMSRVIDVQASVKVDFEGAFSTTFDDQILIADGPRFSRPNDSGASILAKVDNKLLAVGLLMGGSEQVSMANKMTNVARLLGFNLPTVTIV